MRERKESQDSPDSLEPAAESEQVVRCINCGRPVRPGSLLCRRCRRSSLSYRFENCFGPAVIVAGGLIYILTVVVRALS